MNESIDAIKKVIDKTLDMIQHHAAGIKMLMQQLAELDKRVAELEKKNANGV